MGSSSSNQMAMELDTSIEQNMLTEQLLKSSNKISDVVQNIQEMNIVVGGDICSGEISQNMNVDMKFINEVDSKTVSEMSSKLQSEISNEASQTFTKVQGLLADIMGKTDTDTSTTIRTRVKQVIEKRMTVEHVNSILKNIVNTQTMKINVKGDLGCSGDKDIVFSQDMLIKLASESIIQDIIQSCTEDEVISSVANSVKQESKIENKGVDDLITGILRSFTGVMGIVLIVAAVVVVFILRTTGTALNNITSKENYKYTLLFAGILIFVIGYFAMAKKINLWPFRIDPSVKYVCETKDNVITGKCVVDKIGEGEFTAENVCSESGCERWGVEKDENGLPTGECVLGKNILTHPYKSHEKCMSAIDNGTDGLAYKIVDNEFAAQNGDVTKYQECKLVPFKEGANYAQKEDCMDVLTNPLESV